MSDLLNLPSLINPSASTTKFIVNDSAVTQELTVARARLLLGTGFNGSRGFNGSAGFTGSTGFAGSAGFVGSVGFVGSTGYTGSVGFAGSVGFVGSIGFVGSYGFAGSTGFVGSIGFVGSYGFAGSTGFQGSIGFAGSAGPSGPPSTSATSIVGGSAGAIVYQSAPNVTNFLGLGSLGNLVQAGPTAPAYISTSSLHVGKSTEALKAYINALTNSEIIPTRYLTMATNAGGFQDLGITDLFYHTNDKELNSPVANISSLTNASSTLTGALRVGGGAGIGKNLYVGEKAFILDRTNASSTITGALVVTGGAGIGGNLYVGGEIVAQKLTIELTTVSTVLVTTDDIIVTRNTTSATSTSTGALQVGGGAGIGGDLYVGGKIYGTIAGASADEAGKIKTASTNSNTNHYITFVDSNNSTATSESVYTDGQFYYNPSTNILTVDGKVAIIGNSVSTGTNSGALTVLGGVGISDDLYLGDTLNIGITGPGYIESDSTLYLQAKGQGIITTSSVQIWNQTQSNSTNSGALIVRGGVGIAGNLWVGGTINGVISTATIAGIASTSSYATTASFATTASWATTASFALFAFTASWATTASNLAHGLAGQVPYQSQPGKTLFTGPGGTGTVFIGSGTNAPIFSPNLNLTGWLSVGMNTSTAAVGEIRATNEVTAYFASDINLKENIRPISSALDLVSRIRGVFFDWKEEYITKRGGEDGYFVRKHDIGVIAQEIQSILPEVVGERSDGYLAVKYDKIVPLLIQAINELRSEIEKLKTRH